jgi:hypothetical protein
LGDLLFERHLCEEILDTVVNSGTGISMEVAHERTASTNAASETIDDPPVGSTHDG